MNHCRASFESLRRERRPRPSGASRLIGPLVVVLAMAVWPTAVLAAQVAVVTQRNAIVVYIVIILLLGAVAAGLFFASPLRRRLTGPDEVLASASRKPQADDQSLAQHHSTQAPPQQRQLQPPQPPPGPTQPVRSVPQDAPRSSRSAAPPGASQSSPWSTGDASGDAGWDPTHR